MLIQFRVGNYRSFGSEVTFSMEAVKAFKEHKENVIEAEHYRLLRSSAIYGANASGKSNLVKAFAFMRQFVLFSAGQNSTARIPAEPFKLDKANLAKPSLFEVTILLDDGRYRYGFEVTNEKVVTEWFLFTTGPRNIERILFTREQGKITVSEEFTEGRGHESETRDNGLFLSLMDSRNSARASMIIRWFSKCKTIFGKDDRDFRLKETMMPYNDGRSFPREPKAHARWLNFIRYIDDSIVDVKYSNRDPKELSKIGGEGGLWPPGYTWSAHGFKVIRNQASNGNPCGIVDFDLENDESAGTEKFLGLAIPWLDILENGRIAFVDELEARLHPHMTRWLVKLFNSPETNPKNAQLIFVTHDTNLLTYGRLRRDQVWFCEKTHSGSTDLYSLAEIKVRKGAKFENEYIGGKYGAIPYFGNVKDIGGEKE
jgi:uncharacterized protein